MDEIVPRTMVLGTFSNNDDTNDNYLLLLLLLLRNAESGHVLEVSFLHT